jgi:hypothetical protein
VQVVDRFEEIGFALAVLAYDCYAFRWQRENDVRQVSDIANFEAVEARVLLACEYGWALLQEGMGAFVRIGGRGQEAEVAGLEGEAVVERE